MPRELLDKVRQMGGARWLRELIARQRNGKK